MTFLAVINDDVGYETTPVRVLKLFLKNSFYCFQTFIAI